MGKSLKRYLIFALLSLIFLFPKVVHAGYNSWSEVPEDRRKNVEAAWDIAIQEGISEASTAGMLANANSESGYDPFLQQVGGPAWGFFQMESDRQARLKAHLQSKNAMSNPVKASGESMRFVIQELKADNMFLTYGLEGDASGTGRYAGPASWGGPYRYDVLQYVQGGNKKISTSAEEFYKNTDPVKASIEFMVSYERAHSSRSTLHLDQRIKLASEIYEHFSGKKVDKPSENGADTPKSTDEQVSSSGFKFNEGSVPNMPKERDYKESDDTIDKLFADVTTLTVAEKVGIEKWKEERGATIAETTITWTRRFIMSLGIIMTVYPVLLLVAYTFDMWFMFGDSPAMKVVTFKRLAIDLDRAKSGIWFADKKTNERLEIKRMGVGDVLVWSGVFSFVGVLLITGYLYVQFGNLSEFFSRALGY